jgi:hypothetical protein
MYLDTNNPKHWLCIVLGCKQRAFACCKSRHGWHAYCPDHNFAKCGMDQPYVSAPGYLVAEPTPAPSSKPDIGPQSPIRPIGPSNPTPPAPGGIGAPFIPAKVPALNLEF